MVERLLCIENGGDLLRTGAPATKPHCAGAMGSFLSSFTTILGGRSGDPDAKAQPPRHK